MGRALLAMAIAAAALLVFGAGGAGADTVGDLTALLAKYESAPSDGTVAADDPLPFGHTIHLVDRDNKDSWKIDDVGGTTTFEQNACDGDPPLPSGALHLFVPGGEGAAQLRSTRYHRTYLRDLTRLDYWACARFNNGQQWPYLILNIDLNGDNQTDDLLFFEPAYQNPAEGGSCGFFSDQGPETYNVWQFWDALRSDPSTGEFRACYWALSGPPCDPGIFVCPLSTYIGLHPDAAIVNRDGNHGGVRIVQGFDGPEPLDGWVDAFTIGKDINGTSGQTYNSTITYDFQQP